VPVLGFVREDLAQTSDGSVEVACDDAHPHAVLTAAVLEPLAKTVQDEVDPECISASRHQCDTKT
jgi:hypothetical protein